MRLDIHYVRSNGGFERCQVRAVSDIRPVLARVVDSAEPAQVVELHFAPDVFQIPAAPVDLIAWTVAETSRPRLFLILVDGGLAGRRVSAYGAPHKCSQELFAVQ